MYSKNNQHYVKGGITLKARLRRRTGDITGWINEYISAL